jgi:hypothetical protein
MFDVKEVLRRWTAGQKRNAARAQVDFGLMGYVAGPDHCKRALEFDDAPDRAHAQTGSAPSRFARDASAFATIKGVQRWLQKRSAPS